MVPRLPCTAGPRHARGVGRRVLNLGVKASTRQAPEMLRCEISAPSPSYLGFGHSLALLEATQQQGPALGAPQLGPDHQPGCRNLHSASVLSQETLESLSCPPPSHSGPPSGHRASAQLLVFLQKGRWLCSLWPSAFPCVSMVGFWDRALLVLASSWRRRAYAKGQSEQSACPPGLCLCPEA